ncbi:MAG TPA: hypothetical protein VK249_34125 [Anaerolineales bacterium]|nr:hypothetical protein [Anaerolineales bacterium]
MNKTLVTILIVIAVLAVAGGIFFAGSMYARANTFGYSMMFGRNNNNVYGPGMMNRGNGMGPGMMGNGRGGYGMMGGNGYSYNGANLIPLTLDQARQAADAYVKSLNLNGLETGEVMVFDNNAYVVVKETETGLGAFELLVDPVSKIAYPEHGPNMMWNLKYGGLNHQSMLRGNGGMMGGMMGQGGMMNINAWDGTIPANVSAEMTVTPEQAIQYAQKYLDANNSGATAATDPTQFYGYYTLDFEKNGKVIGMLSVNGYSGQVFLHTWHGTFIEEAE